MDINSISYEPRLWKPALVRLLIIWNASNVCLILKNRSQAFFLVKFRLKSHESLIKKCFAGIDRKKGIKTKNETIKLLILTLITI